MSARFQTFAASVRPIRIAVLVDRNESDWQGSCLAILEFLTRVWGGEHAIIVPTDGIAIDDVFWALLSAYDPDLVVPYRKTGEDLRRNHPSQFEENVSKYIQQRAEQGFTGDEIKKEIVKALSDHYLDSFAIHESLSKLIVTRVAPFSHEGAIEGHAVLAGKPPFYPLTSAVDVLDESDRPSGVVELKNDSTIPDLWLASSVGWSTGDLVAALKARNITVSSVVVSDDDEFHLIRWGMQSGRDFPGKTLFNISQVGLSTVRSTRSRTFELPTVFVLGDSIQDFCLYYSLRRLHGRAAWIPSWFLEDKNGFNLRLRSAASNAAEVGRFEHSDSCTVTSFSMSIQRVQDVIQPLLKDSLYGNVSTEALSVPFVSRLVRHPLRVYATGSIGQLSTHHLDGDQLPGPFESLKPAVFTNINPQMHRWLVEVAFLKHRVPRHPALGALVVGHPNLAETSIRIGNDGLAYICPGAFVVGSDVDYNLVRPTIRVPSAIDLFRRALSHANYDCQISDKGQYESEVISKLGGLELAGRVFRDSASAALFDKFLDQNRPGNGVYDDGVYLKDQRRYLNFAAIAKLLGSAASATATIDHYISKAIFYRGLIFRCQYCSNVEWYSIDEVTHAFTCKRCGRNQQYTKSIWKRPDEPSWFYKLDEIVYQALRNKSTVPILTLDSLRRKTRDSFLFCSALRINRQGDQKHFIELDICCIPEGQFCIGEAKSNGTLSAVGVPATALAQKYQQLADELGIPKVVFSTSAQIWDKSSEIAIESAFNNYPHITVSKLTAADL